MFCCHCLKGKTSCSKEISEGIERSRDDKYCLAEECPKELSEREDSSSSETVLPTKSKHDVPKTGGKYKPL